MIYKVVKTSPNRAYATFSIVLQDSKILKRLAFWQLLFVQVDNFLSNFVENMVKHSLTRKLSFNFETT
jgi:hypothetical protein